VTTLKNLLPSLFLAITIAACSSNGDGNGNGPPKGDGGPLTESGIPKPDVEIPSGCEAQCVAEAKHLCVLDPNAATTDCVDCLSDAHCQQNPWSFGPKCKTTTNKCRCEDDGDCSENKNGSKCKTTYGRCHCETDADCAPPLRCVDKYQSTSICGKPCATNSDCLDPEKPNCDAATGKCVACAAADDCKNSPNGSLCEETKCTCKADADCKGDYPWGNKCITTSKRCGCDADGDCAANPNGPKCQATFHKCTCETDAECSKAPYTRCARPYAGSSYKHCQKACASSADCASRTGLKICDAAKGICVACMQDTDCTSSYSPYCSPPLGKCVACKEDSHCTTRDKPFCDASQGKCIECNANADCANSMDGKVCDKGNCKCVSDADCSGSYPWGKKCIKSYGRCGCDADADCSGNPHGAKCYATYNKCTCAGDGECKSAPYTKCAAPYSSASYNHCQKPCASDTDCAGLSGLKTCNQGTGKCVACMKDSDCTSSYYKYCMASNGQCVQCRSDADCAANKTYKFCAAASGKCVECKTAADCAGNPFAKICDPTSGCEECKKDADCGVGSLGNRCSGSICVCATDADCAGRTAGNKCDTSMQACSCTVDADCPTGKKCTGNFLGISVCQ
jgi:hypothetical protein